MLKENLALILCFSIFGLFQIYEIRAENLINDVVKGTRIINGSDATLNESGHQVSIKIRLNDSLTYEHYCGGSLISENVVLCAAHCFINESDPSIYLPDNIFIAVMGTLDRLDENNDNNTLVFDIIKVVKHDKVFNITTVADDIVLVMLNGRVPANHPTVKPITLNEGPIKNNTMCQVTGWGLNETDVSPEKLQIVDQPYVDFNDCRNKNTYVYKVRDGMLCAGYFGGGPVPCSADSGGPLACRGLQAGIVSWGGCFTPLQPTVYVDVAYYKNWILKEIVNHNGTLPKFASISDGVGSVEDRSSAELDNNALIDLN